jgi:hypothetical protein
VSKEEERIINSLLLGKNFICVEVPKITFIGGVDSLKA